MSISLDNIDKRKFPVGGAWTDKERFFRVERAASGRSTCKACKQKIDGGELRIELVWSAFFDHGSPNQGFMHPQCLRSAQARFGTRDGFWKNYGVLYGNITAPAIQLRDYDHLSNEHRQIIDDIFTGDPKTTRPTAAAAAARLAAVTPVSAATARVVAAVTAPPDQKKKAAPAAKRKAASTKRASKHDDSEEEDEDEDEEDAEDEEEEDEEFEPRAKRAKKAPAAATSKKKAAGPADGAAASKKPTAASRKKAAAAAAAAAAEDA
jgi:hypothetical protein